MYKWNVSFYSDSESGRFNRDEKTYTVEAEDEDEAVMAARDMAREDMSNPYCSEVDGPYNSDNDSVSEGGDNA